MRKFANTFDCKTNIFLLVMALVFIGCLNYEQEVSLYPDGSGTMKIHYWMKFDDTLKTGLIDQTGLFNKDSINIKFTSKYFKLESLETYSDTTDSTTHAKIEISFEFIDLLNNSKPFSEANFQLSDGAEGQKVFSQYIPPIVSGFGIDGSEFTVTYIYDFPGEIIVHNANIVEKKRLIWKYTLSEIGKGKTISVTYRPFKLKETPAWIFILSGAVLLIVIFYLFKKKK